MIINLSVQILGMWLHFPQTQGCGTNCIKQVSPESCCCCNILFNQNFTAEIIEIQCKSCNFLTSIAICNASEAQKTSKYLARCYVHSFSPLKSQGPECHSVQYPVLVDIYSVQSFHMRKSYWGISGSESVERPVVMTLSIRGWTLMFLHLGLNFYNSEWHKRVVFLHLPKVTCATVMGLQNHLWQAMSASLSLLCLWLI